MGVPEGKMLGSGCSDCPERWESQRICFVSLRKPLGRRELPSLSTSLISVYFKKSKILLKPSWLHWITLMRRTGHTHPRLVSKGFLSEEGQFPQVVSGEQSRLTQGWASLEPRPLPGNILRPQQSGASLIALEI